MIRPLASEFLLYGQQTIPFHTLQNQMLPNKSCPHRLQREQVHVQHLPLYYFPMRKVLQSAHLLAGITFQPLYPNLPDHTLQGLSQELAYASSWNISSTLHHQSHRNDFQTNPQRFHKIS